MQVAGARMAWMQQLYGPRSALLVSLKSSALCLHPCDAWGMFSR